MPVDLFAFLIFGAAMVGTPGPANMVLLSAGARFGLRPALPFVAGVALGKQLIIWPIGFGLMGVLSTYPEIILTLKLVSAAYILWLAWTIAGGAIRPTKEAEASPGFFEGLAVHPLNPKAWAMVTTGFTAFTVADAPVFLVTLSIATALLAIQILLHPLWCWGGARLAAAIGGTGQERWLMRGLAAATVLSVAAVFWKGA